MEQPGQRIMGIEVVKPGIYSSVHDRGRAGWQRCGVPVSGCMDQYASALVNFFVGNSRDAAVLELTMHGAVLRFPEACLVAFSGGGSRPFIGTRELPLNKSVWISGNSVIDFRYHAEGCRMYMAVAGGFDLPLVMGSRSTYAALGAGKVLAACDELQTCAPGSIPTRIMEAMGVNVMDSGSDPPGSLRVANWGSLEINEEEPRELVRVLQGPEWGRFTSSSQKKWLETPYKVGVSSDRMGYRLKGEPLTIESESDMISTAVTTGTVQVIPDGSPLLLMADAQTTGGYPRIAQVIAADLPVCAQKKPGDTIRFREVSVRVAEELLLAREEELVRLEHSIRRRFS